MQNQQYVEVFRHATNRLAQVGAFWSGIEKGAKMKYFQPLFLSLILFAFPFKMAAATGDSLLWANILPQNLNGWHAQLPDAFYHRTNLYEFIDGAAEVYLNYGFRSLFHRTYQRADQPDILLDIYDMGSGENSYGLFLQQAQNPDSLPRFGQGSQYVRGYLIFWKGPYFISILAFRETAQSKKCITNLAAFIDRQIKTTSPLPALVRALPQRNRIARSLRYFHSYFWLQRAFQLPPQNIFQINDSVKIALARYTDGTTLAVIAYPDSQTAGQIKQKLFRDFFQTKHQADIVEKGKHHFLLVRIDRFLIFAQNDQKPQVLKNYTKLKNSFASERPWGAPKTNQ